MFKRFALAIATLAASNLTVADNHESRPYFSYDQAEIKHTMSNTDLGDTTGTSFSGTFSISNNMFITTAFTFFDAEDNVKDEGITFGLGYHQPFDHCTDLIAKYSFTEGDVEIDGLEFDKDVNRFSLGLKREIHPLVQVSGFTNVMTGKSDEDFSINAEAQVEAYNDFYVTFDLELAESSESLTIGAQYQF